MKRILWCSLFSMLIPSAAQATNGLNMIGFGAESVALGGADVAWSRDTTALNTNPAALIGLDRAALDLSAGAAYAIDVAHADRLGNDRQVDNRLIGLSGFGYACPIRGLPAVVGIGLFAQGGVGAVLEDLITPFGGRDELSSQFRVVKLSLGGAWGATERLSLGLALSLVYADLEEQVFPHTSTPDFAGLSIEGAQALRPGLKLGLLYRVDPHLTLGAAYTTATELPLEQGQLRANLTAMGLGEVTYHDVRLTGLSLPQEAAVGLAWRLSDAWLLSTKLAWLDWSSAVEYTQVVASEPDHPAAPSVLRSRSTLEWRDQYVMAFGVIRRLDPDNELLAGYNYGRSPIRASHTQPLLAAIPEHHLTLGLRHRSAGHWEQTYGIEYQPGAKVRYSNPESVLGAESEVRSQSLGLYVTLGRRW